MTGSSPMKIALSRHLVFLCLVLLLPWQAALAQGFPGASDEIMIETSLVAESDRPAPGASTTLAIVMAPQAGWHGYWKQPGDVGLAPRLDWRLPEGVTAGAPAYPVPRTLRIDGMMNHVYERPYALLVPVEIPPRVATGTRLPIELDLEYLACREDACIPERASLATTLTVGDGTIAAERRARFDAWRRTLPRPLGAQAGVEVADGTLRLSLPLPASVTLDDPHLFVASEGAVEAAAEQRFSRDGDTLVVETAVGEAPPARLEAVLALGDGRGLALHGEVGAAPALAADDEAATLGPLALGLTALLGAIAGGVLLNVMPCVFPILSLKVLSLAKLSGADRDARREALAYTAGVVGVCVLLGAVILALRAAGTQVGWAFQLQDPRVIVVLTLLTAAIGFNLAGLFELGTFGTGARLADQGGVAGAFWTGALAAFVATPCSGPFMATALGVALVLPPFAALGVFAGLGLGIALPFLVLGYVPVLRRRLPRPGPWMQGVRHGLAIPMFLTALALLWVLGRQLSSDGLVASIALVLLLAIGLWWTGLRQRGGKRLTWGPAALTALLALAGGALVPATFSSPSQAAAPEEARRLAFDAQRLAELRQQEAPLFLYFTADWCVTCQVNERRAIDRQATRQAFRQAGVITMVGDWTNGDPAITAFLRRHGRSGVPLYLWYPPGERDPEVLPQLLPAGVLPDLAAR